MNVHTWEFLYIHTYKKKMMKKIKLILAKEWKKKNLKRVTKWWRKTESSTLASSYPGHSRGPPPNGVNTFTGLVAPELFYSCIYLFWKKKTLQLVTKINIFLKKLWTQFWFKIGINLPAISMGWKSEHLWNGHGLNVQPWMMQKLSTPLV